MVGFFPALIVTSILIGQAYKEFYFNKKYMINIASLFPYLITIVLLSILVINKYTFNYQDFNEILWKKFGTLGFGNVFNKPQSLSRRWK